MGSVKNDGARVETKRKRLYIMFEAEDEHYNQPNHIETH